MTFPNVKECMTMTQTKELMADKAYDELKWRILNGEVEPGQLYTENAICDLIDLGRSPVRSALSRLQHDRLIDIIPRKGMLVRGISSREIKEIIQVRLNIEPMIARLATQNAQEEDIAKMEALLDQVKKSKFRDRKLAMRIDHEFHIALAEATGNTVLAEVLSFIKKRSSVFWFRSIVSVDKMKEVQQEHQEILDAVKAGDEKAAVKMVTDHIAKLEKAVF